MIVTPHSPQPILPERRFFGVEQGRFPSNHGNDDRWGVSRRDRSRHGSVLVGVLWCLALLAVVVIGTLYTSRLDLRVVKNYGDTVQAHYLALAGVEKAKAVLYHDARNRKSRGEHYTGELSHSPSDFMDVTLGRGKFRVIHHGSLEEGGGLRYGVVDEESRLNMNHASAEEMAKLPGLNEVVAAAIIDYRDPDDEIQPNGAETPEYLSLNPPYVPRNGPFLTVREMLMVTGVSPERFAGEDANLNALLEPNEDDGSDQHPPDNGDGFLDAGWSGYITVDSSVRNLNAFGESRAHIQDADAASLGGVRGFDNTIAQAIVDYRGQNELENLLDLLEVRAGQNRGSPRPRSLPQETSNPSPDNASGEQPGQPSNSSDSGGPRVISEELLMQAADDLTATDDYELQGVVNINTAGAAVLSCLPVVDENLARNIVTHRRAHGPFPNTVALLRVAGMSRDNLERLMPRITVRSDTFRVLSEGKVTSSGATKRIEAVVRIGSYEVITLAFREDL